MFSEIDPFIGDNLIPKTLCFRFWREAKNISRQNWLSLDTNFDETMDRNAKPSLL
jgi:hypothetical protein